MLEKTAVSPPAGGAKAVWLQGKNKILHSSRKLRRWEANMEQIWQADGGLSLVFFC